MRQYSIEMFFNRSETRSQKNRYLQPICWKHLLCTEISVDVYVVCVISGRVVNCQPKHTA